MSACWRALECEPTPVELAPLVTAPMLDVLGDITLWAQAMIDAHKAYVPKPAIQLAKHHATPTELRRTVTDAIRSTNEQGITRGPRHKRRA